MLVGVRRRLRWPQATGVVDVPATPVEPAWRIVFGGWLLLSLALVAFVLVLGQNSPLSDEWAFLAALTGEKPLLPWLWEPHNEHRFPLPRLVWVSLHRISGYDFRAPMVLSVVLMAGTTLALLAAVRKHRGRAHPADLLIPALLLHFGHWENWLIGYQLAFTIPAATTGIILASLARATDPMPPRTLLACGLGLVALVLCGGPGVILALPLSCWVAFAAVRCRKIWLLIPPLAAIGYVGVYLALRQQSGIALPPSSWNEKAGTALEFLAGGMGKAGLWAWPVSGFAVGLLMLCCGAGLMRVAIARSGSDRHAALGLLAVLVGVVGIAAAIGLSRTGLDTHPGFSSRYGLFSALGLATVYLAAARFGTRRTRSFQQCEHTGGRGSCRAESRGSNALAGSARASPSRVICGLLALGSVLISLSEGIAYGQYYGHATRSMQYRIRQGDRPEDLVPKNVTTVFAGADTPETRAWMLEGMHVLARHRIGVFRPAKPRP